MTTTIFPPIKLNKTELKVFSHIYLNQNQHFNPISFSTIKDTAHYILPKKHWDKFKRKIDIQLAALNGTLIGHIARTNPSVYDECRELRNEASIRRYLYTRWHEEVLTYNDYYNTLSDDPTNQARMRLSRILSTEWVR